MLGELQGDAPQKAAVLRTTAFCSGLPERLVEALAYAASDLRYSRGSVLFQQGEAAAGFFLLISGAVDLVISGARHKAIVLGSVSAGQALGLAAVIDSLPHPVTAIAVSPVESLYFPRPELLQVLEASPQLWFRVSLLLSECVREAYNCRANLLSHWWDASHPNIGGKELPTPEKIDLNSAPVSLLTQLPGVSKDIAYDIVNYRERHRGFSGWEDLRQIPSLARDKEVLAAIENSATLGPRPAAAPDKGRRTLTRRLGKSKDEMHKHG
jgi:CRP-like cAMP-binding protein